MTLRVYDYGHLGTAMLSRARKVAAAIFKEFGAQTAWVDCPTLAAEFGKIRTATKERKRRTSSCG